jgi:hypothetical protein
MSKNRALVGVPLLILLVIALWSSSLIAAAPLMQIDPTAQQQTVAAIVQQRFDATAHPGTPADQAASATDETNALADTAFLAALAGTANPQTPTDVAQGIEATQTAVEDYNRFVLEQTLRAPVAASIANGIFDAYFLTVPDGLSASMSTLKNTLTTRYGWKVQDIEPDKVSQLTTEAARVDGQVLIIPGGSAALSDADLKSIQDYVAAGGNLIILAGTNLNANKTSLATSATLNDWLFKDFGVKFDDDVVVDQTQAYQSPLVPVATTLDPNSFITNNGIPQGQAALVFEVPNSITIADPAPQNVTVTALAYSTAKAYAKTNLQDILNNKIDPEAGSPPSALVLAASAENTQTGAHVVLLGSTSLGDDRYANFQNIDNLSVVFNSLIWSTNYDDYFYKLATVIAATVNPMMTQVIQQTVNAQGNNPQPLATSAATSAATSVPTSTPQIAATATNNPTEEQQTEVGQSFQTLAVISHMTATALAAPTATATPG